LSNEGEAEISIGASLSRDCDPARDRLKWVARDPAETVSYGPQGETYRHVAWLILERSGERDARLAFVFGARMLGTRPWYRWKSDVVSTPG